MANSGIQIVKISDREFRVYRFWDTNGIPDSYADMARLHTQPNQNAALVYASSLYADLGIRYLDDTPAGRRSTPGGVPWADYGVQAETAKDYFRRDQREGVPASGVGSRLEATIEVRALLTELISQGEIGEIVDVPCGDWTWMSHVDLASVRYTGLDVVPDLITQNRERFGPHLHSDTDRCPMFRIHNILSAPFGVTIPPTLVICRDLFIHLSVPHIFKALFNIIDSGASMLLTTTYPDATGYPKELDYSKGIQYRPVNLEIAPFNLKPKERRKEKHPCCAGRELILVDLPGVQE